MATADFSQNISIAEGTSEGAALHRHLDRLAVRHNRLRFWNELAKALAFGVGISALGILAYKFYLLDTDAISRICTFFMLGEEINLHFGSRSWQIAVPDFISNIKVFFVSNIWWQPLVPITLSALIGYRNGVLKRTGAFDAAMDADQTLKLNDRLASALAFTHPTLIRQRREAAPLKGFAPRLRALIMPRADFATATPTLQTSLVPALVRDAATRAGNLDPKEVYPLRFGRPQKALLVAAIAFSGFAVMPNMTSMLTPEQRTDAKKTLPETGKKLQAIAKDVKDNKDLKDPETKKLGKKLMALGKRMERARMGKKEALVEMAQLREKVAQAAKQSQPQDFKAELQPAADELRHEQLQTDEGKKMQQHLDKGETEKAAKELENLAKKLETGNLSDDEKKKAANDLEKAANALRKQGGEQNEQMAQKLEQAAKALREEQQKQGQQGQKGEAGQKKPGQGPQDQKQGQKQGQQSQNGQQQQGQNGQKQGQQQQGQNGQQQGEKQGQPQQNQSGQQQGGQKPSQQGSQQQSGKQSGQQNSKSGNQQAQQGGSEALRKMAEGMKSGGSGAGQGNSSSDSQSLQRMLDQIKEAERQAGSGMQGNPGSNPGQSGRGGFGSDGDQPSLTPGKDIKPTDPKRAGAGGAGLGRRDHIQGFNNKGGGLSDQRAKRTGDKRRWADVWAPKLPATQRKISRIKGNLGQGEVEQLQTEGDPKGGPVKTPYYDVYDTYKKEADDAVGKEVVPPAYKQPVKDYFDSIKPGK